MQATGNTTAVPRAMYRIPDSPQPPNLAIDDIPAALHFGERRDDHPECLVIHGMFGLQLFQYDEPGRAYIEKSPDMLWKVPLSSCRKTELPGSIPWPGGWGVRHYWQHGFDNLGYPAAVCTDPSLADYLDNPGLLVLLIANPRAVPNQGWTTMKRVDLLRTVTGLRFLGHRHLKWLRRVRPGRQHARELADRIGNSLLRLPAETGPDENPGGTRAFIKLVSHQRRWTPEGLELARILLTREVQYPWTLSWILSLHNGDIAQDIAAGHRVLSMLLESRLLPKSLEDRLDFYLCNPESISPAFVKKLVKALRHQSLDKALMELSLLFISDADLPRPVIAGNDEIIHLDTLERIRKQAVRTGNCLWTAGILWQAIAGKFDLYALRGLRLYTFAVDRRTLEIETLESAGHGQLAPSDLGKISRWYEAGTRLPRTVHPETDH